MKYLLTCGCWSDTIDAIDLDDAKVQTDKLITYTQEDMVINDKSGEELCLRRWWGCLDGLADIDDPIQFGNFGFYGDWIDIKT